MDYIKRFEADQGSDGGWMVFDNQGCYCVAGPMSEEAACEMAARLNAGLKEQ